MPLPPRLPAKPSNCAAQYVRMSTELQQYSPENQAEVIKRYAASHGMEIVKTYADHGRSGLNLSGRDDWRLLCPIRRFLVELLGKAVTGDLEHS
jgi:hypothetical protein